jgi:hypothetical protein
MLTRLSEIKLNLSGFREPLKLVPLDFGSSNKRKRKFLICCLFSACMTYVMYHLEILVRTSCGSGLNRMGQKNAATVAGATMPSPAAQVHSIYLHHDGTRKAGIKSMASCYPLGKIVINLCLKDLESTLN